MTYHYQPLWGTRKRNAWLLALVCIVCLAVFLLRPAQLWGVLAIAIMALLYMASMLHYRCVTGKDFLRIYTNRYIFGKCIPFSDIIAVEERHDVSQMRCHIYLKNSKKPIVLQVENAMALTHTLQKAITH